MKQRLHFILLFLMLCTIGTFSSEANDADFWFTDMDVAVKVAREKKLPILLSFSGSDWCGLCVQLDRSVFQKKEWQEYAVKTFVPVCIDIPRDKKGQSLKLQAQNEALARAFYIRGMPTMLIVEEDGRTLIGLLEFSMHMGPKDFIWRFRDILRGHELSVSRLLATLSEDDAKIYKKSLKSYQDVRSELLDWLDTRPLPSKANEDKYYAFEAKLQQHAVILEKIEDSHAAGATTESNFLIRVLKKAGNKFSGLFSGKEHIPR